MQKEIIIEDGKVFTMLELALEILKDIPEDFIVNEDVPCKILGKVNVPYVNKSFKISVSINEI